MFSWPMITGSGNGGLAYILTSVPQMPAASTLSRPPSSGMSGIGNSRSSVRPGPVLTAASTCSAMSDAPHWYLAGRGPAAPEWSIGMTDYHGNVFGMGQLTLHAVTRTQGATAALKDGSIQPAGYDLAFEEVPVLIHAFRRMVRELAYDVTEMAFT